MARPAKIKQLPGTPPEASATVVTRGQFWVGIAAVVLALIGGVATIAYKAGGWSSQLGSLRSNVHQLQAKFGRLRTKVDSNATSLARIEQQLIDMRLHAAALTPLEKRSQEIAVSVLHQAIRSNIRVSPKAVVAAGRRFIAAARTAPSALRPAVSFLNYRSFLNHRFYQRFAKGRHPTPAIPFLFSFPTSKLSQYPADRDGHHPLTVTIGPQVPLSDAAISERIKKPLRAVAKFGPAYIAFKGDIHFVLDGFYLRNVAFIGGIIVYHGGPLILKNVYFINCRFEFRPSKRALDFADEVLAHSAVHFGAAG